MSSFELGCTQHSVDWIDKNHPGDCPWCKLSSALGLLREAMEQSGITTETYVLPGSIAARARVLFGLELADHHTTRLSQESLGSAGSGSSSDVERHEHKWSGPSFGQWTCNECGAVERRSE